MIILEEVSWFIEEDVRNNLRYVSVFEMGNRYISLGEGHGMKVLWDSGCEPGKAELGEKG